MADDEQREDELDHDLTEAPEASAEDHEAKASDSRSSQDDPSLGDAPSSGAADARADDGGAIETGSPENDSAASDGAADSEAAASGSSIDGATAAAAVAYHPSYIFLAVVTVVNLVGDLWSKSWAKNHFESLRPGDPRRLVVWEEHMNFIFAKNRGGAWGLLQNETESLRRPFFLIVSVAAIVFIVSLYRKLQPGQMALKWGLPLVLGGALGNLVDRIRYGYVVDFIDVYMQMDGKPKHWPTFNVADISICVGVALMAIDMFTSRDASKHKETAAQLDAASDAPTTSEMASASPTTPSVSDPKAKEAAGEGV